MVYAASKGAVASLIKAAANLSSYVTGEVIEIDGEAQV